MQASHACAPLTAYRYGGRMNRIPAAVSVGLLAIGAASAHAQYPAGQFYSPNVHLMSHVPLGAANTVMDLEVEQELSRPYAYVSRSNYGRVTPPQIGYDLINLKDPTKAGVLLRWRIDRPELHQGIGATNGKYFKLK